MKKFDVSFEAGACDGVPLPKAPIPGDDGRFCWAWKPNTLGLLVEVVAAPKPPGAGVDCPKLNEVGVVALKFGTLWVDCWPKLKLLVELSAPVVVERPNAKGLDGLDAPPEPSPTLEPGARRRLGALILR